MARFITYCYKERLYEYILYLNSQFTQGQRELVWSIPESIPFCCHTELSAKIVVSGNKINDYTPSVFTQIIFTIEALVAKRHYKHPLKIIDELLLLFFYLQCLYRPVCPSIS